jgi:D-alanyl-D-alanine dipeptidase
MTGRAGLLLLLLAVTARAQPGPLHDEEFVDLAKVAPGISIELRYGNRRNVTGRAIYPPKTRCLIRRGVAERLKYAHFLLRQRGYGLKIWDAYRPFKAQRVLCDAIGNTNYIADPARGGSLHAWGVAVDATLVDAGGREMEMPTDFDVCTREASMHYFGSNPAIAAHLRLLQGAMGSAGFYGMRGEWWHFIAKNWSQYRADRRAEKIDPRTMNTH